MTKRTKAVERRARDARINVRLHSDLQAALEDYARKDGRSLSGYVERVLVDHARQKGAPLDVAGKRHGS
jgi:hypothetical protein